LKKLDEIRKKVKLEAFVGLFLLVAVVTCGIFLLPGSPTNENDTGQAVATLPPVASEPVPEQNQNVQSGSGSDFETYYGVEPAYTSDYSGDSWNSGEENNPVNPETPTEEPEEEPVDPGDITDPEEPIEEPVDPGDITDPEEPEDPVEEPEDPADPEEPIEEPVDPGDIEDPGFEEEVPEDVPDDIDDWINN
jgi:hypothetical protein